jgi:regulatory protein
MKITKIEVQKLHPNRRSIFVDDKFFAGVDEEVVAKLGLSVDKELSEALIQKIYSHEVERKAKDYGMNLLSYRSRSIGELRKKMHEKGFEEKLISTVISDFKEMELLDDRRFAREWMMTQMLNNPKGSFGIQMGLKERDVPENIIEETLKLYSNQYDELEIANSLKEKRMKVMRKEKKETIQKRLSDFLARRGFSYDVIGEIIHNLHSDDEGKK